MHHNTIIKILWLIVLWACCIAALTLPSDSQPKLKVRPYKRAPLQDIVTWDEHSLLIRGERLMLWSGEFHPFRLPVPGLWLDVFQKIKAMGYNCVSFYVDFALVEGNRGEYTAQGIFALEPFFEAAQVAGIYLLARPGPYINAEASGGGYPGWFQRIPAVLRTRDPQYLAATDNYMANVGATIAKAQITNGGPIILCQPENEYTYSSNNTLFPDADYYSYVENQLRSAGIIVPLIENDAAPLGHFTPGTPSGVDIYGYDGYPLGFDCANPYTWPAGKLPTDYGKNHSMQSPSTPNSIVEFQGGSFDPWGGTGFAKCLELIGYEFERVFFKNDFSFGVTIFNTYMSFGGTNWGNLGHPGGYTSYDYAAQISEDRLVSREKYSETKLQANFLMVSPAFLTAVPQNDTNLNGSYTGNVDLATSALFDSRTKFFIVRHAQYQSLESTNYHITLPTSQGSISVPQLSGQLSLHGRDSKFHVVDYDVGGINILYSTAEIFTWKRFGKKRVLIVYGGPNEQHELAVAGTHGRCRVASGPTVTTKQERNSTVINFTTSTQRRVVTLQDLEIHIVDRNTAYNYWVIDLPSSPVSGNNTNATTSRFAPIVKVDDLLRTVKLQGDQLHLTGDLNATSPIEVIGAPRTLKTLSWNGQSIPFKCDRNGIVTAQAIYSQPTITLPDLASVEWKYLDSLPEIKPGYDDSLWTRAELTYTNNTIRQLSTPRSLYASDYGFNAGSLLYRGTFVANGDETMFYLSTAGGYAFGHSIWINDTFVASFNGADKFYEYNDTYSLPAKLQARSTYVFTILIDHTGLDEDFTVGSETMKNPRGILDYNLTGHDKSDISWKLTGNLHGESYVDKTRGPLNEGALFAERQGYHLPNAPTADWTASKGPQAGISQAGVAFFATNFDLNIPEGYDVPLSFSFNNATEGQGNQTTQHVPSYRCQIFVNGYQYGKYVHNIGPQDSFPVPPGIINPRGNNYVAVSLWALDSDGALTDGFSLQSGPAIMSGYGPIAASPQPGWSERAGVY